MKYVRRAAAVTAAALTMIGAQFVTPWATPDVASAVSPRVRSAESSNNSDPWKGAFAECSRGERVVGGGARIVNGNGRVGLVQMNPSPRWPTASPDVYYAWAQEKPWYPEYTGNWKVVAYAICVQSMPGLTYVTASGSGQLGASADAPCPPEKVVVGTGASVNYLDGYSLQWIRPMGAPGSAATSVRVQAQSDVEQARPGVTVGATAISANPPPGYEFLAQGLFATTNNPQTVTAQCPTGKSLLGGGLTKHDPWGHAQVDGVYPDLNTPEFTTTAQLGPAAAAGMSQRAWAIAAWAICATATG